MKLYNISIIQIVFKKIVFKKIVYTCVPKNILAITFKDDILHVWESKLFHFTSLH